VSGTGNGSSAEVIAGLRPATGGAIRVDGEKLVSGDARDAIRRGVAYIPEDRMGTGVAPNLSVAEN